MNAFVSTNLGEISQVDLDVRMVEQPETVDAWIVARECTYKGTQFPEAVGQIVRRDVWVTMKQGQAAKAAASL